MLAEVDFDETPRLTFWVLAPSLLALCGSLAHLRIRPAIWRMVALLAGMFAGLFFWLAPLFTGMVTPLAGILVGSGMVLLYGIILTVLLLAPMIVVPAIVSWRSARAAR